MTLTNEAPSSGLPGYVLGAGASVPKATNRNLVTVYSPLDLSGATVDGSAAVVQTDDDLGLRAYGVPVDLAPDGGTATVTFRLSGPPPAGLTETGTYTLTVVPQPLARPDLWSIQVVSGGRQLAETTTELDETLKIEAQLVEG